MRLQNNIVADKDGYKFTHPLQYISYLNYLYSYGEDRFGAKFNETCFIGMDMIVQDHFLDPVTTAMIDEAEDLSYRTFGTKKYFNRETWEKVRDLGYLPIEIKAVPEGSIVPISNALFSIDSTEPWFATSVNGLETMLMHVWYPTTIATNSMHIYKAIESHVKKTGTEELLPFMCHDFGMRGVTGFEQGYRGGLAHLVWFNGTDTTSASRAIDHYYGYKGRGLSVWATEHSVATSFGPGRGEFEYILHQLNNAPDDMIISMVIDTYNAKGFIKEVVGSEEISSRIKARKGRVVFRPDSGKPTDIINSCLMLLKDIFGSFQNHKGYQTLDHNVGLLQGDGMKRPTIDELYSSIENNGWSSDNLVVGSGGGLLQEDMTRDTNRFAIKSSYGIIGDKEINFQKNPLTDQSKQSKPGKHKTVYDGKSYRTVSSTSSEYHKVKDEMRVVLRNGVYNPTNFQDVLDRSKRDYLNLV